MFASQYRPGFITTDEPLDRDVEVADLDTMRKLPWVARWEQSSNFKEFTLSGDIVSAKCTDGSWVVGYLTEEPLWCLECSHWITYCGGCKCSNSQTTTAQKYYTY